MELSDIVWYCLGEFHCSNDHLLKMMLFLCTTLILIGWSSCEKTVEALSTNSVKSEITPATSSLITEKELHGHSQTPDSRDNKLENWKKVGENFSGNHHKITKRNSLSRDNEISFYSKLIRDLQELIDREQEFFPEEKRYFGRYRSSNHLIKSLNGMDSPDRDSQIAKHFRLIRSRRSVGNPTGDSSQHDDQSGGNNNYIMNAVRNMLNQNSDKSVLLGKRFLGRLRNSNYILTKQRLGNDIKELLKNHWNSNWNKRMDDLSPESGVIGTASPQQSSVPGELPAPKKRFQVDLDYSFLWSLMMNKDKEAAERALKMYMNP